MIQVIVPHVDAKADAAFIAPRIGIVKASSALTTQTFAFRKCAVLLHDTVVNQTDSDPMIFSHVQNGRCYRL